ncbi:MAG: hypothetical protein OEU68_16625 [Nitrospira sp.]|nr:hypothetical protein [Nitrospira sp.]MDH4245805.1 hypothetical protein [Nitrospira sp.]MDH4357994.1 hypothetical protein [Nitrospira sp.]MDH5320254.1 hypothetical protein [Nitrospira sp.]
MSETISSDEIKDTITFVDDYQTRLNAGTYEVRATLTAPAALEPAKVSTSTKVKLHVAGPRFFLPPSEVHSVFPPENGEGDYNNVLPHVVLNRRTLPWERLVDKKRGDKKRDDALEQIPFLALLVFTEDEEANGDVTPPTVISLEELGQSLEPGEKPTDKVNVIDVKRSLLEHIMPTGEELRLLVHGRERIQNGKDHWRAVVIANRLPASGKRNIAHLVMLENRYEQIEKPLEKPPAWCFKFASDADDPIRLVCLKSWQFTCSADKPTLRGRLLGKAFTFESLCVPKREKGGDSFEQLRSMSYAALPYHLRWGDRAHTLYHGPLVAAPAKTEPLKTDDDNIPASADGLVRLLQDQHIFDVSLAAAWQLGRLLMLRDQSVAMEYFGWRRRDAQLRAREAHWDDDGHLQTADDHRTGLSGMPEAVRHWCAERLQLRSLPFEYLVPDARMVPEHSLRIFRIHEGWMACLLSGALALGRAGDFDRHLEAEYLSTVFPAESRGRTGFLLRSPAVDEHPDLEVAAFGDGRSPLKEVRLERIGPGLLLGLYEGTISRLQFSLPPLGLHFGLKEADGGFAKDLRSEDGSENKQSIGSIAMRTPDGAGLGGSVVDVSELSSEMKRRLGKDFGTMTPGRFAFQMCEGTEMVEFDVG